MLPFILSITIAFALGYGVREIISRRRHKKIRYRRAVDRFDPNELELFRAIPGALRKRRRKVKKDAVSDSELPKFTE
jgi:hypothetical protein